MTPPVRELTVNQCWAMLRTARVGRLAALLRSRIEIFPVTFLTAGGTIVFRTGEGTKVAAMTFSPEVAFEVDGYDSATGEAWSVVAHARAEGISDEDALALAADVVAWQPGPKHRLVQLAPTSITGRAFAVAPAAVESHPEDGAHSAYE